MINLLHVRSGEVLKGDTFPDVFLYLIVSIKIISIPIFITCNTIEQSSPILIDQPDQRQHDCDPAKDHHHVAQPEQGEVAGLEGEQNVSNNVKININCMR